MSLKVQRHIVPDTATSNHGGGGLVDHLPTWAEDQPHGSVLVQVFGQPESFKLAELARLNLHPFRKEQARTFRGHSLAD